MKIGLKIEKDVEKNEKIIKKHGKTLKIGFKRILKKTLKNAENWSKVTKKKKNM